MALLHATTLTPSKPELLAAWVPTQPWGAPVADLVAGFRFDDPDGEVGIETHLVRTEAGHVLQVPVTYRSSPLAGAQHALVGKTEHGVLGTRWVHDATLDPVYVRALAAAVLAAAPQAELIVLRDGQEHRREPSTSLRSTGTAGAAVPEVTTVVTATDPVSSIIESGELRVVLRRRLDLPAPDVGSHPALFGTWAGQDEPVLLAHAE